MGEWNFSRNECVRALKKLGFMLNNKRTGPHDKFYIPEVYRKNLPQNVPPFIMIPRHNHLKVQRLIVRELEMIGGDELVEKFKACL